MSILATSAVSAGVTKAAVGILATKTSVEVGDPVASDSQKKTGDVMGAVAEWVNEFGAYLTLIVGVGLLAHGIIRIAKALASDGHGQVSWVSIIAEIVVGALFTFVSGWQTFRKFVGGFAKDFDQRLSS